MRKGFTVLELLVASLLLGMLMTILTMIFSQSSIAWRTGVAGVSDMNNAREDISDTRYKADNAYEWNGAKFIHSVFGKDGKPVATREDYINSTFGKTDNSGVSVAQSTDPQKSYGTATPRKPSKNGNDNYIVNVRSWGPDRKENTRYDNIYSVSPTDDPGEW